MGGSDAIGAMPGIPISMSHLRGRLRFHAFAVSFNAKSFCIRVLPIERVCLVKVLLHSVEWRPLEKAFAICCGARESVCPDGAWLNMLNRR